ncbi:MAG: AsnC family protein [Alphaproteobacteria bacterium]|nr:AsnC family protein [Alphaproteobacteria bacterium]
MMPAKRLWTDADDTIIAERRARRASWDGIAATLCASRSAVIDRARLLGVPPLPPLLRAARLEATREPLKAGDPRAWAVLTEATLLAGTEYPYPPLDLADVEPDVADLAALRLAA